MAVFLGSGEVASLDGYLEGYLFETKTLGSDTYPDDISMHMCIHTWH